MKKLVTPISVIFILFILGCAESATKQKEINVFVGTEGLAAEFAKNAPPPRVFEESSFPILLRIRNNGAYSISKEKPSGESSEALVSIGREKDYVPSLSLEENSKVSAGSTDNEALFNVDGKTEINPKGDEVVAAFSAKTGRLDPQSETRLSTITATLCYPYQTVLATTICIDPDVTGTAAGKKVCNVKELVFNNGQGAPIAITKIEPRMILEGDIVKPQFLIFIENKGRGNPANIFNFKDVCRNTELSQQETKYIWNVAFLRAYSSANEQLICCPNIDGKCDEKETNPDKITGFIRFRDKKDFVRCSFKSGMQKNSAAYTSPLKIQIDYGYTQTISANFYIQKPLKY